MPSPTLADHTAVSHLRQEYYARRELFEAQSNLVQRFFEAQAHVVAGAILQKLSSVRFSLPDQVLVALGAGAHTAALPAEQREHKVGGLALGAHGPDLGDKVGQHLTELEHRIKLVAENPQSVKIFGVFARIPYPSQENSHD